MLLQNPESHLFAVEAGWKWTVSREQMVLMDLYDLTHSSLVPKGKARPKPYPRPWPDEKSTRIGGKKTVRRTVEEVRAILRPHRGPAPMPDL